MTQYRNDIVITRHGIVPHVSPSPPKRRRGGDHCEVDLGLPTRLPNHVVARTRPFLRARERMAT